MNEIKRQAAELAAFKAAERARWKLAQPAPITEVWRPTITEREAEQRKKDIEAGLIPF